RDDLPGRHGDREVARRDDADHAQRTPVGGQFLVVHLRRHRLPVEPAALRLEEVAGVDGFLNAAARLLEGLAHLAGDEGAERFLLALERLTDAADELTADGGRRLGPRAEGLPDGNARVAHQLLARLGEQAVCVIQVAVVERGEGAGAVQVSATDETDESPGRAAGRRDGRRGHAVSGFHERLSDARYQGESAAWTPTS